MALAATSSALYFSFVAVMVDGKPNTRVLSREGSPDGYAVFIIAMGGLVNGDEKHHGEALSFFGVFHQCE